MKQFQTVVEKYATAIGIVGGLSLLTLIGVAIVLIPEEAGLAMIVIGLTSASVSMFLIARDLCRQKNRGAKIFPS